MATSDWSSLPNDLLTLVLERLPWSNHPSFSAACRHWRSVVTPFFPAWLTPLLLSAADVGSTNLRFYSPYYHKSFEISSTLAAPCSKICSATGRRLTLLRWRRVLEADLTTGHTHELPPVDFTKFDFVVYDGDRSRIFGVYTTGPPRIAVAVRNGDGSWQNWNYPAPLYEGAPMIQGSPTCNPILHGGLLYVLYGDGRLAIYDEKRGHDEDGYLEILEKPKGFGGRHQCEFSYLFESDEGELMAIRVGRRGTPVHVAKLNEKEMEWEEVGSLGGRALFTGTFATIMRKTSVKWMRDKIFLPRLHEWPDTVHVDIVDRDGELAFVPTKLSSTHEADAAAANEGAHMWSSTHEADAAAAANEGAHMWSYEVGSSKEPTEFWDTEKVDYSIWVDFNTHI